MPRQNRRAKAHDLPRSVRLKIEYQPVEALLPYVGNARTHSDKQINQIAASIRQFGFVNPILVGDRNTIIAGHGRLAAAKQVGLTEVPTLALSHLSDAERKTLVIADNRLAELAGWDDELLRLELRGLAELDLDFELEITGFETAELDALLTDPVDAADPDDEVRELDRGANVTRLGDVWQIGAHRLICGDARDPDVLNALVGDDRADLVFTDPPYNVRIDGHVCGSGAVKHREFAMASGEMTPGEFQDFLRQALQAAAKVSRDGAIHFVCMDWRHLEDIIAAGRDVYTELKNLIAWVKTNAGMGSFYRSQHELILVFKVGKAAHTNTFGLGDRGRYRTNVWTYPGVNSFGSNQKNLALHPTVKPVALIADAIKDVSRRGEIVLDIFGGSGSTLIAAERTGRRARLVEIDPAYCEVIIRRAGDRLGLSAELAATGQSFEEVAADRSAEIEEADDE
ncbi:site-specific DNA-methyltransferase [Hyphobacterium sp. SN044]|uniref:site-specific DNA-methyltransferase n=1 Tax=Hyphobacterium sp. SN044 TaxID=2912575 RepID=UPI001F1D4AB1|nr:DNA methyltransferase [Hyphobacterium sp. SN044]MCF8880143.1 site-specific DNA-methyltransferase [Hyphobacterium sp. SN044]